MARLPSCSTLLVMLPLAVAACAAVPSGEADKEKMESMLNTELMTGDSAETIEAFFQRHGIAFTYDPAIRRYAGMADLGDKIPLSVYVYTDTDKKMTVSLVQAPKAPAAPAMRATQRPRDYYVDVPGAAPPRPIR